MNDPFLTALSVTKSYQLGKRSLEVLRGVSLTVNRGEFVALRGASGAGKSTLLHLLGGLDSPNAGQVYFQGRNLAEFSDSGLTRFRNQHIGFIFQDHHLLPQCNVLENVLLPALAGHGAGKPEEDRARRLLERVGLSERVAHLPAQTEGEQHHRRTEGRRDDP